MNPYYFGNALGLSGLYMLAGIGSITAIKSGEFNLGGEGQIYTGGFICAIILNFLSDPQTAGATPLCPPIFAISLALLLSAAITSLLGLISALLKNYKNAEPLFTSFIISAAIIPILDGLISGPFRTTSGNLLSTPFVNVKYRFPSILPPSTCNASLPAAILLCIAAYFIFDRTSYGRRLSILGVSREFAKYSGYRIYGLTNSAMMISSALHGLCGAVTVIGTYYTCYAGFYSGIGWNALSAALIASLNPLLLIPSSLVLGFLITYTNKLALFHNVGFDLSSLLQGIILFLIAFTITKTKAGKK